MFGSFKNFLILCILYKATLTIPKILLSILFWQYSVFLKSKTQAKIDILNVYPNHNICPIFLQLLLLVISPSKLPAVIELRFDA